ncbi:MAG: DUF6030 family protein [Neobacillus sp.]
MHLLVIFILSFCTVISARADLLVTAPPQACNLLREAGLATSDWKNEYDQEYGCSSEYKQLSSGAGLANNLAFYVEGNSSSVFQVYLMLNVNDKTSVTSAHKELLKVAEDLSKKETGKQLPKKLIDAINKGNNASQKVGTATVDVVRNNWTTGKGYDIKFIIK